MNWLDEKSGQLVFDIDQVVEWLDLESVAPVTESTEMDKSFIKQEKPVCTDTQKKLSGRHQQGGVSI